MKTGTFLAAWLLPWLLLAAPMQVHSKQAGASTTPGRYEDWGPDIDQVEIFKAFRASDYERVSIEPLATDGVELPAADENTHEPVKATLARFTALFAEGVRSTSPKAVDTGSASTVRALRIRGKVLVLDPGSRAKRYWGGFGAGAVRVAVQCEIVDAATNEVLLTFTQERRSGFGGFGGGYEDLMARTIRQVGSDAGHVLEAF